MWWKIYFWLDIALVVVSLLSFYGTTRQNNIMHIFLIVTYCIALIGLYSYVFNKKILNITFWKIYLWFYLLLDAVYLLYILFPTFTLIHFLSFISIYQDNSVEGTVIDTALDIPLLYALFRLSLGKTYENENYVKKAKKKPFRWGLIQTALWGYSSILTFFLFILAFFPTAKTDGGKEASDPYYVLAMFAPLLIFWLWVIFRYKQYKWNWWRTTLIANAVLYSGTIVFGLLFPQQQSQSSTSGFDIISVLQLTILLLSFYVFGKEQVINDKLLSVRK